MLPDSAQTRGQKELAEGDGLTAAKRAPALVDVEVVGQEVGAGEVAGGRERSRGELDHRSVEADGTRALDLEHGARRAALAPALPGRVQCQERYAQCEWSTSAAMRGRRRTG